MTDWTPARARRVLAEIFEAPDPTDVEAHDAWHAEQDALELAGRILGSMTRSDCLDLAVRLDALGHPTGSEIR